MPTAIVPCSLSPMDDDAFLQAFETGTLPNAAFHHRDHLRLTWLYLRRDGPELGAEHIVDGIRHFATIHGAANRFHVTLTHNLDPARPAPDGGISQHRAI